MHIDRLGRDSDVSGEKFSGNTAGKKIDCKIVIKTASNVTSEWGA